jgi:hypothetical protein
MVCLFGMFYFASLLLILYHIALHLSLFFTGIVIFHRDRWFILLETTAILASLGVLPMFHSEGASRSVCLDRITPSGLLVAAMLTHNANAGLGTIVLRPFNSEDAALAASPMADKR